MRLISSILFLILSAAALAVPGDLNGNGMVVMGDLLIMADSWLTDDGGDLDGDDDTDFADFCILAAHWLEGCDAMPTVDASNASAGCAANGEVTITLTAQSTSVLTYQITSFPPNGLIYDGQTLITSVPRTLTGNQVRYVASEANDSFSWSASTVANDCGISASDNATASITIYITPTAIPQSVNGTAYIWQTITLAATDDGLPNPPTRLKYIISSLPAVGLLYDPKSGAGKIDKVPYSLSSWGTDVLYITDTTGNSSFGFKATDCGVSPLGGESVSAATVSITTAANPLDCLSFDGQGYVTIPDGTYLDLVDGRAMTLYIKTHTAYGMLIDKRVAGAGYEIKLVAGRPMIQLWTSSGLVGQLSGTLRIDNAEWIEVEFSIYSLAAGGWRIKYECANLELNFYDANFSDFSGSVPDFTNSEPVLLCAGYKNEIDKLRFYSSFTEANETGLSDILLCYSRTSSTELVMGIGKESSVLFMCDEHSGTTITDSKTGKVGTFSSSEHVAWHPWLTPFIDVSVQQYYRRAR